MAIVISNLLLISIFITYRTYQEDPQFSYLRILGLQLATFLSTDFNQSQLLSSQS
ncbi:hypothetical protein [Candidatus Albibeggiatoa sp. nov. BB20]|uniref:hypothetical protein n=1 Tax=Candidatus Albibeggiatoa sp. nov. BB20 TaxID=3162723 RepID=UPI0033657E91